jgi:hypothetical protein
MTAELPGLDRCPKCSAAVKPGDPWCTLCYADLRPPAPPPPAPVAADPLTDPLTDPPPPPALVPSVVRGPDPLTAPLAALDGPTWPCATCGATNRIDRDTCVGCGSPFLSALRDAEGPLLELPVVGDITRLGRGQRVALAGGVVLVVVVLTLLIGLVFG